MKNLSTDSLFQLIESLTKEEKRYFRLFAQSIGGKATNYLKIYDILSKQTEYDEASLKQKLHKQKIQIANLAAYKQYLYQLILKSLQVLHQEASVEEEILSGLKNLKILHRKGLFGQLETLLDKLFGLCVQYDKLFYLPRLYEWLFLVQASYSNFNDWDLEHLQTQQNAFAQAAEALTNYIRIRQDTSRAVFQVRRWTFYSRNKALNNWLEENPSPTLPPQPSLYMLIAHAQGLVMRYAAVRDWEKTVTAWQLILDLFQQKPHLLKDSDLQRVFVSASSGALVACLDLNNPEVSAQIFSNLQQIQGANLPPWVHFLELSVRLLQEIKQKDYPKALFRVQTIENFMEQHPSHSISALYVCNFYFAAAVVHIWTKNWESALQYLDKILEYGVQVSKIMYNLARILVLLVYYEKGEFLLMPYSVRSVYRHLFKTSHLYGFERLVLKGLNRLAQLDPSPRRRQKYLLFLKQKFAKYDWQANHHEKEPLDYFNFIDWVDSKLIRPSHSPTNDTL